MPGTNVYSGMYEKSRIISADVCASFYQIKIKWNKKCDRYRQRQSPQLRASKKALNNLGKGHAWQSLNILTVFLKASLSQGSVKKLPYICIARVALTSAGSVSGCCTAEPQTSRTKALTFLSASRYAVRMSCSCLEKVSRYLGDSVQ